MHVHSIGNTLQANYVLPDASPPESKAERFSAAIGALVGYARRKIQTLSIQFARTSTQRPTPAPSQDLTPPRAADSGPSGPPQVSLPSEPRPVRSNPAAAQLYALLAQIPLPNVDAELKAGPARARSLHATCTVAEHLIDLLEPPGRPRNGMTVQKVKVDSWRRLLSDLPAAKFEVDANACDLNTEFFCQLGLSHASYDALIDALRHVGLSVREEAEINAGRAVRDLMTHDPALDHYGTHQRLMTAMETAATLPAVPNRPLFFWQLDALPRSQHASFEVQLMTQPNVLTYLNTFEGWKLTPLTRNAVEIWEASSWGQQESKILETFNELSRDPDVLTLLHLGILSKGEAIPESGGQDGDLRSQRTRAERNGVKLATLTAVLEDYRHTPVNGLTGHPFEFLRERPDELATALRGKSIGITAASLKAMFPRGVSHFWNGTETMATLIATLQARSG